jgi:hypothetical protein
MVGGGFAAGLMAGPMITQGNALFLAAAGVVGTGATLLHDEMRRRRFPDKYPAAFFMKLADEE